jgi:hypothetical protein
MVHRHLNSQSDRRQSDTTLARTPVIEEMTRLRGVSILPAKARSLPADFAGTIGRLVST